MQNPKINYLIACASHRAGKFPNYGNGIAGKDVLRLHIEELLKTDTSRLSQVTVIRALPLIRNAEYTEECEEYWDVIPLLNELECTVKFLDVPDAWFSYSSWIHAGAYYLNNFDYYILCEDDYYPVHPNFMDELVKLHQKKLPNGGYLASFATDHGAVSNGIVDAKSFVEGINRYKHPIKAVAGAAQINFTTKFFDNLAGFLPEFRCLGWFGNDVTEINYHDRIETSGKDIFLPIQSLGTP